MASIKDYFKHLHIPFWWMVGVIVACVVCCASCRTTRYVTVPEYHKEYISRTDTFLRHDVVRDTSWMTIREVDSAGLVSLGLQIKGLKQALLIERYRNTEKTLNSSNRKGEHVAKTDSIRVPYRVEVEKKLSWWDQVKVDFGGWAMVMAAAEMLLIIIWLIKRYR